MTSKNEYDRLLKAGQCNKHNTVLQTFNTAVNNQGVSGAAKIYYHSISRHFRST